MSLRAPRQVTAARSIALPVRVWHWSSFDDMAVANIPCILCGDELSWELLRGDGYELDVFRCKPCGLRWQHRTDIKKPEPNPEPVPAPKIESKPLFCRLLGCR